MCPTLKLPRPQMLVVGQGHSSMMFLQFPDHLFKAGTALCDTPVALVVVQGIPATAK